MWTTSSPPASSCGLTQTSFRSSPGQCFRGVEVWPSSRLSGRCPIWRSSHLVLLPRCIPRPLTVTILPRRSRISGSRWRDEGPRRLHTRVFVRQCRVVKQHEYGPGGCECIAKELTASAPSAMKIMVVAPPDLITLTVGSLVVSAEDQRAPRR